MRPGQPRQVFRDLVKRSGMKTARAFYRRAALVGVRVDGSGNFRLRPCQRDGKGFLGATDDQVYDLSDPDSTTLGERLLQALEAPERLSTIAST